MQHRPPGEEAGVEARSLVLVSILFFASGAAGLIYEVVWFKRFSHVWGSSALSAAAVLASFLLGLGLGAGLVGRFADRARSPLRLYGLCEIGIAVLALLVPHGIRLLERAVALVHPLSEDRPLLGALIRSLATFAVIGPPCILMGGTLPLLVRELTPPGGMLGRAAGALYGMNTLGGAAGAYFAGFHLLPALGLPASNSIAAAVNTVAGAAALALGTRRRRPAIRGEQVPFKEVSDPEAAGEPGGGPTARRLRVEPVLAGALITGAASLLLQVAWNRELALVLGGSTYAFTAMLAVVLAGIGIGGLVFHAFLGDLREPLRAQAPVIMLIAVAVVAGQLLVERLVIVTGSLVHVRTGLVSNAVLCASAAAVLELIPAIGMGILLPLYAAAAPAGRDRPGRSVGDVYAWNTVGTIAGALGGALVALPTWGIAGTAGAAVALYAIAAVLLSPTRGMRARVALLATAAIGTGSALLAAREPDPVLLNLGLHMYGCSSSKPQAGILPLFIEDGATSSVMVGLHGDGRRSLRVNGKVDASDSMDMATQLGIAYFPRLLRPGARDVLVIGFGSGTTSGASLLFPGTRVTCAEIEKAVVEASVHFEHVNHRPRQSAMFRVITDDGRALLQGSDARYDLVLSEPSNPWMAGVANLFTREFHAAVESRLQPGGILGQWVQAYGLAPSDYATLLRTVLDVFDHAALVMLPGTDTLLLASNAPLDPDTAILDAAQALVDAHEPARKDLETHFGTADVRSIFLRHFILDGRAVRKLCGAGGEVHGDLDMKLEFLAPLRLLDPGVTTEAVRRSILAAADTSAIGDVWARWGCGPDQLGALRELAGTFTQIGDWKSAAPIVEHGLTIDARDARLLGMRLVHGGSNNEDAWEADLADVLAASHDAAAHAALLLSEQGHWRRAAKAWESLAAARPESASIRARLAESLNALGDEARARRELEEARRLDPFIAIEGTDGNASQGEGKR